MRRNPAQLHRNAAEYGGNREQHQGEYGACGVTQKKDDHRRHEQHFKKERSRERSHRFVNKLRAVIYRKNLDSFGQLN